MTARRASKVSRRRVAVVGSGPRGIAVVERVAARVLADPGHRPVDIYLIDAEEVGCGRIWRSTQPEWFLMNTVCGEVTMFSGDPDEGPARPGAGPSLAQWWSTHEPGFSGPDGYAPRALHGRYQRWVVDRVETALERAGSRLHRVLGTVEHLERTADGYRLDLLDSGAILADKVVLATGHSRLDQVGSLRELAGFAASRPHLRFFQGDSVASMPLDGIAPGSSVGVLGLGLTFYDLMLALSVGRGGRFTGDPEGTLTYVPSGDEPVLVGGSRSGVPLPARGRNQKPSTLAFHPALFTPERVCRGREFGTLDFATDVLPWNVAEIQLVYYRTVLRERDGDVAAARFTAAVVAAAEAGVPRLGEIAEAHGVTDLPPLDLETLARPFAGRSFGSPADFDGALLAHLHADLEHADRGNYADPVKAALDVLRDTRWVVREIVDYGGLTPDSHREAFLGWFAPRSALLAAGPPRIRLRQALALMEAGVLRVVGPDARFGCDPGAGRFVVSSPAVEGSAVTVEAVVDARTPNPDVHRDLSALTRSLLSQGIWTGFVNSGRSGDFDTGGVAVTRAPYHPVGPLGEPDTGLYVLGVPAEHTRWFTFVGSGRPGPWNEFTRDADAIAAHALEQHATARRELSAVA